MRSASRDHRLRFFFEKIKRKTCGKCSQLSLVVRRASVCFSNSLSWDTGGGLFTQSVSVSIDNSPLGFLFTPSEGVSDDALESVWNSFSMVKS